MHKELFIRGREKPPAPEAVALNAEQNWPADDERIARHEANDVPSSALNPEEALMAKEEEERDAGVRSFRF